MSQDIAVVVVQGSRNHSLDIVLGTLDSSVVNVSDWKEAKLIFLAGVVYRKLDNLYEPSPLLALIIALSMGTLLYDIDVMFLAMASIA